MDGFYRQPGVIEKQVGIGHFYFLRQGFDILIMDLQFAIQRCPYLPLQFKSAVFHHPGSYRVILFIFRITDDNGHAILQAGETSPHRKPVMTGTAGAAQEQRRGCPKSESPDRYFHYFRKSYDTRRFEHPTNYRYFP